MIGIVPLSVNPSNSFFQGRKALVTGAGGHLGSQLVCRLITCGAEVTVFLRSSTDRWRLQNISSEIKILQVDIKDFDIVALAKEIGAVDTFYHLAAAGVSPHDKDASAMMATNVMGTLNALKLAREIKVRRFIYCGSCFEYGEGNNVNENTWPLPLSEYGASKVAGWVLANTFYRKYGLPVVSLRPFTLYGPWESKYRLISQVINNLDEDKNVELTSGHQKRNFVFILDAVEAFLNAGSITNVEGQTFNVASQDTVSIKDVVVLIMRLMDKQNKAQFGVLPMRSGEPEIISGNTDKAKMFLHWQAHTGLEEGLRQTIEWVAACKKKKSYAS